VRCLLHNNDLCGTEVIDRHEPGGGLLESGHAPNISHERLRPAIRRPDYGGIGAGSLLIVVRLVGLRARGCALLVPSGGGPWTTAPGP
jgi:hypothetical protein